MDLKWDQIFVMSAEVGSSIKNEQLKQRNWLTFGFKGSVVFIDLKVVKLEKFYGIP